MGLDGVRCSTVVDGAISGDVFEAFVEQVLLPQLQAGNLVVMDDLSSHQRARSRQFIESRGARWLLSPTCSPDLNPIENLLSQVKGLLRSRGGPRAASRSMHFYANWRHQYPVPTRPFSDWNYIDIQGQGVYAGDTLTVMSPSPKWYGEGDERIYVDGETFPSHQGTGTEDYQAQGRTRVGNPGAGEFQ